VRFLQSFSTCVILDEMLTLLCYLTSLSIALCDLSADSSVALRDLSADWSIALCDLSADWSIDCVICHLVGL